MLVFKKDAQIQEITAQDMLSQDEKCHIVYDTDSACHYFYLITLENGKKQLLRFAMQKLSHMPYNLLRSYHTHDAYGLGPKQASDALLNEAKEIFNTLEATSPYLSQAEIAELHASIKAGVTPEATEDQDWYIENSPLTKAQQQQLLYGQITAIPIETFDDHIAALTPATLEASIRADDTGAPSLTDDEQYEVKLLLSTYLNPEEINKFLLNDKSSIPTLGDIHNFFVETIKQHILKKYPERAGQLHQLKTLKKSGPILLGTPNADFQNEGISNPQGLSEVDDTLFRATYHILSARPDDIAIITLSLFESSAFKQDIIETDLLEFLECLQDPRKNPSSIKYIEATNEITACFGPGVGGSIHLHHATAILRFLSFINKNNQLTPQSRQAIINNLTQNNFKAIIAHKNLLALIAALSLLEENGKLDEENLNRVLNDETNTPFILALLLCNPSYSFSRPKSHLRDSELEVALLALYENKILTQKNVNTVVGNKSDVRYLKRILKVLEEAQLNTEENYNTVLAHDKLASLSIGLNYLKYANLLDQTHFDELTNHPQPLEFGRILSLLNKHHLYNQANVQQVLKAKTISNHCTFHIEQGLSFLDNDKILNQENFEIVCTHREPLQVGKALTFLNQHGLLKKENVEALLHREDPCLVSDASLLISQHDWFTPAQRLAVLGHKYPLSAAEGMITLQKVGILESPYEQGILEVLHPETMAQVLSKLHELNILSPESLLDALSYAEYSRILKGGDIEATLSALYKDKTLTQEVFRLTLKSKQYDSNDHLLDDLKSLSKDNKLFDQPQVINALNTFKTYIDGLPPQPNNWKKKADELYKYAFAELHRQTNPGVNQTEVKAFAQKIVDKAHSLWGTDHQAARMILDVLLITLSLAGVGLLMIGVKKATTGHSFFYLGKQQEQDAVNTLTEKITNSKPNLSS